MRSFEQRIAEIHRRSEKMIKLRRQRRKHVLMACIPLVLCVGIFAASMLTDRMPEVEDGGKFNGIGGVTGSTAPDYRAQYIRTNGGAEDTEFPGVYIIRSTEELNNYYNSNKQVFDLERKDKVYADTTIGFLDACDRYDDSFFENSFLLFVLLEEGSGSVRHEVRSVEQEPDRQIVITIDSKVPEVCTDDMAQWHIILELSRDAEVSEENGVLVYLDGKLLRIPIKIAA